MAQNKKKLHTFTVLMFSGICIILAIVLLHLANRETGNQENTKPYVAIITKSTTSAYWKSTLAGANAASTAYNINISFDGPENEEDYVTQNEMIRKAVADGAKAIVFSAIDYNANAAAINEAAAAGVKIVVIDSAVNSNRVSCSISTDNYAAGKMVAEAVLADSNPELKVGIVNFDKNSENGQKREAGFRDGVAGDSRVEIVDSIHVISTTEDTKEDTIAMLAAHPEINVIVTFNEWTSLGVGYAVEELGLEDKTHVVAFDSNVISVGMLETGAVDALIVQNPYAMGYLGVEYANALINDVPFAELDVTTDTTLVTKENMYTPAVQRVLFVFD